MSDQNVRDAVRKFVPTSQRVYGVRVTVLNQLEKEHRTGGLQLADALWKSGAHEERLLAAKLIGSSCRNEPDRALAFAIRFASQISDWAVCDTLATQGLRGIATKKRNEIFAWSNELVRSDNPWERRLGVVLLTNFAKEKQSRIAINATLDLLKGEKEYYVKKAVEWLAKDLEK